MKTLITIISIISFTVSIYAQKGYSLSTSTRISFTDKLVTEFNQIVPTEEQTNIYDFSFKDKMLVHHIVYSDRTVCQFYRINSVDKIDENSYYIEAESGSSGNKYYYYINDVSGVINFYQIDAANEKNQMSGTKFGGIGVIQLVPFIQE